MNPILISIGNFDIKWYPVILAIASFIGIGLVQKKHENLESKMTLSLTCLFGNYLWLYWS